VRNDILVELQKRLSNISGSPLVLRNPKAPPSSDDFPVIVITSAEDTVADHNRTGDYPRYIREWDVFISVFIMASVENDDEVATTEIDDYLETKIKKAIYEGGNSLGGKCSEILEEGTGLYVVPPMGEAGIGITAQFLVRYLENTANLY
jgi:hypothetical protein